MDNTKRVAITGASAAGLENFQQMNSLHVDLLPDCLVGRIPSGNQTAR